MKIAIVLFSLLAGTLASPAISAILGTATPEQVANNERIVTGQIIEAIEDIARQIREAGYDPWIVNVDVGWKLPVEVLFTANALVDNVVLEGISNIVVESMNFSILQSRLTFNIVLPGISLSLGNIEADAIVFGEKYEAAASGSLSITQIRLIGDVRVNVGVISGISVRSLTLNFSIGGIQSQLDVAAFGRNLSPWLNDLLGTRLPGKLNEYAREINQLLEIVALQIINDALNPSFFKI